MEIEPLTEHPEVVCNEKVLEENVEWSTPNLVPWGQKIA
jgi:hypothetical protein